MCLMAKNGTVRCDACKTSRNDLELIVDVFAVLDLIEQVIAGKVQWPYGVCVSNA